MQIFSPTAVQGIASHANTRSTYFPLANASKVVILRISQENFPSPVHITSGGPVRRVSGSARRFIFAIVYLGSITSARFNAASASSSLTYSRGFVTTTTTTTTLTTGLHILSFGFPIHMFEGKPGICENYYLLS